MATMVATYSARNASEVGTFPVPLHQVRPSTLNPRQAFDQARLVELAESIQRHGLLEPIVVRDATPAMRDDRPGEIVIYEIVAGERRFRASWLVALARCMGETIAEVVALSEEAREAFRDQAGRETIEARHLGAVEDKAALELALVENLVRQDLDPIEEAEGYAQLNRVVGLSQSEIGKAVNRSQPAVANAMRLLDLPDDVRERIRRGELSVSHGVALARFKAFPPVASGLAEIAVQQGWTAKGLERPQMWSLANAGIVRSLDYQTLFDRAACKDCPFGALHEDHYCLKPDHYDELQAAARKDKQAEIARAAQELRREGGKLLDLKKLNYTQYNSLSGAGKCEFDSAESPCPCRVQAKDGERLAWICCDPPRRTQLQAAATRAQGKEKKRTGRELAGRVVAALDARGDDPRPLSILEVEERRLVTLVVAAALRTVGRPTALKEAQRHVAHLSADDVSRWYGREAQGLDQFQATPLDQLLRFAAEALLRSEIADRYEGYGGSTPWADWFLAHAEAPAEAAD